MSQRSRAALDSSENRKTRDENTNEPQTRPPKITLETVDDTDVMMKKMNSWKYAED